MMSLMSGEKPYFNPGDDKSVFAELLYMHGSKRMMEAAIAIGQYSSLVLLSLFINFIS